MRFPVNRNLPLAALAIALTVSAPAAAKQRDMPPAPVNGPQADYPMVLGQPFEVDGVNYTPVDTMNYDAVGYAAASVGGSGVSGSHRTLPLPSYVEVTALDTGRTILVRLERRGPMTGNLLVELSPAAAEQLGIAGAPRAAVRVRRVNPPEPERAVLRAGQAAPARMDTPPSLLTVLKRRLDSQGPGAQVSRPGPMPLPDKLPPAAATQATTAAVSVPAAKAPASVAPKPSASPVQPAPKGKPPVPVANKEPVSATGKGWAVQIGAFSSQASAEALARKAGGSASAAGRLWRVRLGPFATRAEADAALAKARASGYKDASVQPSR